MIPNAFQSPNDYVDIGMELLTPQEFKCLIFAARHILGWQDKINDRQGVISLTMFEHGYTSSKGQYYAGTGLSRHSVVKALEWLTKSNLLAKLEKTIEGQRYELSELPDWDCLRQRRDQELTKNQTRTTNARKQRAGKSDKPASVSATNQQVVSPTNQQPVSNTNQERLVAQHFGGLVALTESIPYTKPDQSQKEKEIEPSDPDIQRRAAQKLLDDAVKAMDGNSYEPKSYTDAEIQEQIRVIEAKYGQKAKANASPS